MNNAILNFYVWQINIYHCTLWFEDNCWRSDRKVISRAIHVFHSRPVHHQYHLKKQKHLVDSRKGSCLLNLLLKSPWNPKWKGVNLQYHSSSQKIQMQRRKLVRFLRCRKPWRPAVHSWKIKVQKIPNKMMHQGKVDFYVINVRRSVNQLLITDIALYAKCKIFLGHLFECLHTHFESMHWRNICGILRNFNLQNDSVFIIPPKVFLPIKISMAFFSLHIATKCSAISDNFELMNEFSFELLYPLCI